MVAEKWVGVDSVLRNGYGDAMWAYMRKLNKILHKHPTQYTWQCSYILVVRKTANKTVPQDRGGRIQLISYGGKDKAYAIECQILRVSKPRHAEGSAILDSRNLIIIIWRTTLYFCSTVPCSRLVFFVLANEHFQG